MPGYEIETSAVNVGGTQFQLCALLDKQQFSDPFGLAERAGISSATWPLFGVLWPAGQVLAEAASTLPIDGLRILEVGCGLGLASLVLKQRGANVTACDHHPLAGEFLARNTALNKLDTIPFHAAQWLGPNPGLGRFDVLVASDVLYERDHVALLAGFFAAHAQAHAQILITDPGRGHANALTRALAIQGYRCEERRCPFEPGELPPWRGRLLHYRR